MPEFYDPIDHAKSWIEQERMAIRMGITDTVRTRLEREREDEDLRKRAEELGRQR